MDLRVLSSDVAACAELLKLAVCKDCAAHCSALRVAQHVQWTLMSEVTMQQLVCIINCRNTTVHIKNKARSVVVATPLCHWE